MGWACWVFVVLVSACCFLFGVGIWWLFEFVLGLIGFSVCLVGWCVLVGEGLGVCFVILFGVVSLCWFLC